MIHKLAEEIYSSSVHLKQYDGRKLLFKKYRLLLLAELRELKSKTDALIRCLSDDPDYSAKYCELSQFMSKILSECSDLLQNNEARQREKLLHALANFHNLPRVFLSPENPFRISAEQAMDFFTL